MDKQKEIQRLREKLLKLGQPIIIPARELPQPKTASEPVTRDITIVPVGEYIPVTSH